MILQVYCNKLKMEFRPTMTLDLLATPPDVGDDGSCGFSMGGGEEKI